MMVEDVERLSPELERDSLSKFEIFTYSHIPIIDPRSAKYVSSTVAKLTVKRLAESCVVQVWSNAARFELVIGISGQCRVRDVIVEPVIEVLVEPARIRAADLVTTIIEAEHYK